MSDRQKRLRKLKSLTKKKKEMEEGIEAFEDVCRIVLNTSKGDGPKKMNRVIRSRIKKARTHLKNTLSNITEKIDEIEAEESLARPSRPVKTFSIPKKRRGKAKQTS